VHHPSVDPIQLGSALRRIRVRQGLRQREIGERARVSQMTVSRVERGDTAGLQLRTITAVAAALEAQLSLDLRWRGGELPRVINAGHAAMHEAMAFRLHRRSWLFAPEVSFSIYGERGVIDILAFHPARRALLVWD
jgi:transcriptional regulator with XRE-family HTH domain